MRLIKPVQSLFNEALVAWSTEKDPWLGNGSFAFQIQNKKEKKNSRTLKKALKIGFAKLNHQLSGGNPFSYRAAGHIYRSVSQWLKWIQFPVQIPVWRTLDCFLSFSEWSLRKQTTLPPSLDKFSDFHQSLSNSLLIRSVASLYILLGSSYKAQLQQL